MKKIRLLSLFLTFVFLLGTFSLCVSAEETSNTPEIAIYGVQSQVIDRKLAIRIVGTSTNTNFDRIGMTVEVYSESYSSDKLETKTCYTNTYYSEVKSGKKTITAEALGVEKLFAISCYELAVGTTVVFINITLFYVLDGNTVVVDKAYTQFKNRKYVTGMKNYNNDKYNTFLSYANTAYEDLISAFWYADKGHFHQSHDGIINDGCGDLWENGQSLLALATYYEATDSDETYDYISKQWKWLQSSAYNQKGLQGDMTQNAPYAAQDDAAWGVLEFMAIYRVLCDEKALDYAHNLIVNIYNYWGTGETIDYDGTKIKSLEDGLYYSFDSLGGKSIYAAPVVCAALEYCMEVAPNNPTSVDIYEPTINLYNWLETNMCRDGKKTYTNYNGFGNKTVTYVDYLYYVDYERGVTNGPNGADNPSQIAVGSSNTALFGNMAMAVAQSMLYKITNEENYKTLALRTMNAIDKYETHPEGTYINDRDANTNSSMLNYYVKYVLTLPEATISNKLTLLNTSETIANYCNIANKPYYYCIWVKNAKDYSIDWYDKQPPNATNVHMAIASLLLLKTDLYIK